MRMTQSQVVECKKARRTGPSGRVVPMLTRCDDDERRGAPQRTLNDGRSWVASFFTEPESCHDPGSEGALRGRRRVEEKECVAPELYKEIS